MTLHFDHPLGIPREAILSDDIIVKSVQYLVSTADKMLIRINWKGVPFHLKVDNASITIETSLGTNAIQEAAFINMLRDLYQDKVEKLLEFVLNELSLMQIFFKAESEVANA